LSFDNNNYYNSNNNSQFCVPTIEDNHHDVHQQPLPSVRRRRSSIAPGGLVIKPQILLVPSRIPQPRTSIESDQWSCNNNNNNNNNSENNNNNNNNNSENNTLPTYTLEPATLLPSSPSLSSKALPTSNNNDDDGDVAAPLPLIRSSQSRSNSLQNCNSYGNNNIHTNNKKTWRHSIHAPEIITITPRTSSNANGGGSNSNNYISFSKPILEVTTTKPEILGDFLSGLQNIDGDVVSGDRNGGFKDRKW